MGRELEKAGRAIRLWCRADPKMERGTERVKKRRKGGRKERCSTVLKMLQPG